LSFGKSKVKLVGLATFQAVPTRAVIVDSYLEVCALRANANGPVAIHGCKTLSHLCYAHQLRR
jgi:hypothetical protein